MEDRRKGFLNQAFTAALLNKRLIIRAVLSLILIAGMVYLAHLLFFHKPDESMKDMVNVMLGAILMAFSKIVDFWFKKDEEDVHENKKDPI